MASAIGASVVALLTADETALAIGVRLAALGVVAIIAGLARSWSPLIPVGVGLIGAAYATHLALDDPALDLRAPALAALMLLTTELAYWSLEEETDAVADPGDGSRRAAVVALFAAAALVVSASLLTLVDAIRARGLAIDLVGAAAAAGALLALVLAARARRPASR